MAGIVLATNQDAVIDAVESTAAALRAEVVRAASADEVLARWNQARALLIGPDLAAAVASAGPRKRADVFLVGFDPAQLGVWSMPLGATVIPLPHGVAWLSAVLSADPGDGAPVVAVTGGSGGVGASTLAVGLAQAAAMRGMSAALVDADPAGGGLDLLIGAEGVAGHRWPRLVGARGEVGDIRGLLPEAEGVTVVSMARGDDDLPGPESVQAVLGSLARYHDLVVADCGRAGWGAARSLLRSADQALLVVSGGVRSVAAAARVLRSGDLREPGVVVRAVPGVRVPPEVVADSLGLDLAGWMPNDGRLVASAEAGDAPWRARSRWARAVDRLLDRVLMGAVDVR